MKLLFCMAALAASLPAEIADAGPGGFTIQQTWTIKAASEEVYKRFMNNVGDWWSSGHTFSGDSHNLSIEPRINGCFCEKLPNNGGVRHLEIIYLVPGKTVRFSGALGPFQSMGVSGVMTIQLKPAEGATQLSLTYTVSGFMREAPRSLAAGADAMLKEQFTRFQHFAETGSPEEKK